jgi:signal transduction histidine kinase
MTPQFYVVLAFFLAVAIGFIILIQRMDRITAQAEFGRQRQDEAAAALREHVKVSAEKLDQRLQRLMEAEVKAQVALDTLLRAQHAAVEANSKATDQLSGAINDLRAALIESTKL